MPLLWLNVSVSKRLSWIAVIKNVEMEPEWEERGGLGIKQYDDPIFILRGNASLRM